MLEKKIIFVEIIYLLNTSCSYITLEIIYLLNTSCSYITLD